MLPIFWASPTRWSRPLWGDGAWMIQGVKVTRLPEEQNAVS